MSRIFGSRGMCNTCVGWFTLYRASLIRLIIRDGRVDMYLCSPQIARALGIVTVCSLPAAHAATTAELDFFEARVRPVLAEHCYPCHGPES